MEKRRCGMNAKKTVQLTVETQDKVGMLEKVSSAIADSGANITAVCAYGMQGKAIFMVTTSDSKKAASALREKGFQAKEDEVVEVKLENSAGMLGKMGSKLAGAGINLKYIYGTVADGAKEASLVFASNQNDKAIELLKQ